MRRVYVLMLIMALLLLRGKDVLAGGPPLDIPASAYLLMDAASGQILVSHQADQRVPMASTTKIMTALLAIERGDLATTVTVSPKAYETGGTTAYLEVGEQQTLENLLYALMLQSANDAAVAIAEHLAGTEEAFVAWMNEKAAQMGAKNTHFVNSHGLHDPAHYTTAYDLALMARYAMRNQIFRDIVGVEERMIPGAGQNPAHRLYNLNRLLGYYDGANGVKNGYTEEAKLTNVASAKRGDTELIAVVLGVEDRIWTLSMALLDHGFENFRTHVVIKKGDVVAQVQVEGAGVIAAAAAEDAVLVLPVQDGTPTMRTTFVEGLKAPLQPGARVGSAEVLLAEKVLQRVDLIVPYGAQLQQGNQTKSVSGAAGQRPHGGLVNKDYLATEGATSLLAQVSIISWAWPLLIVGAALMLFWATRRRVRTTTTAPFSWRERHQRTREQRILRHQKEGSPVDAVHPHAETEIFMPTTVATATGQDGHKKVFFTIPQIEGLIKRVRDSRPREFTYRWAYHPRHNVHVLFANWPSSDAVGIAIPEGTGDWVLNYMLGVTDIYLTTEPVEHLQGTVNHDEIQKVASGNTVPLFGVKFKPDA